MSPAAAVVSSVAGSPASRGVWGDAHGWAGARPASRAADGAAVAWRCATTPARRSRSASAVAFSKAKVRRRARVTLWKASAASLLPASALAMPVSGCQTLSPRTSATFLAAALAEAL
jgi:hypothetical protein